jgi:hypothetical protein
MFAPEVVSQSPRAGTFRSFLAWASLRATRPAGAWGLAFICALALGLRVFVAWHSIGTNDIHTWQTFARLGRAHGVTRVYELHPLFNHPPLMGWYSVAVLAISDSFHAQFSFVFKLVPMLADTLTIVFVQSLGQLSPLGLLVFAVNPANVLISAYHGNTDCLCALGCVASVYFADRGRPYRSALSLAAALNVKLIPVALIAPLMLSLPLRQMPRFVLALSAGALPFVPVVLGAWEAFQRNALQYNSSSAPWGLGLIASALDGRLRLYQSDFIQLAGALGKPLILGGSALLGALQLWLRPFTRAQLAGLTFSWFLLCSPGFGAQYIVYPAAFLVLTKSTWLGFRYLYLAGAFAFLIYFGYWTGTIPVSSDFALHGYDLRTMLVGFLTWITLAQWNVFTLQRALARVLRMRRRRLAGATNG